MGMFDSLRIAASGMTAGRLRMDVIADNLANAQSTRGADGQPYRRKEVVLQAGDSGSSFDKVLQGVHVAGIAEDATPGQKVYDPGHPDADAQGYVTMPNVSSVTEMVDLIDASRGYEANVQTMSVSKQMFAKAIEVLK
jgi:flagellar basal-body rod protein FlgC